MHCKKLSAAPFDNHQHKAKKAASRGGLSEMQSGVRIERLRLQRSCSSSRICQKAETEEASDQHRPSMEYA